MLITPSRRILPRAVTRLATGILSLCLLCTFTACSDDDTEDPDYRALRYTVASNAPTTTSAQIAIKVTVLGLYEEAVMSAIEAKLGEEPDYDDDSSEISIIVPYSTKTDICDNYIESYCLQLEDEVEETSFSGNIVVTNTTTGSVIYSHTFS